MRIQLALPLLLGSCGHEDLAARRFGVFFPPDRRPGSRIDAPACCLVETSRTHRLPGQDPEPARPRSWSTASASRREGYRSGRTHRPHEIQKYPTLGGYETIAVSTNARQRHPGAWEVAIRQILAVNLDHVPLFVAPQYRNIRIRVSKHSQLDRLDLARVVARLCRYPPWLLRGDPGQVLDYLAARADLRLWAAFGKFRGGKPKADDQKTRANPDHDE